MAEPKKTTTAQKTKPVKSTGEVTLLDDFAMSALASSLGGRHIESITVLQSRHIAEACYIIAEAMVEEREKHGE